MANLDLLEKIVNTRFAKRTLNKQEYKFYYSLHRLQSYEYLQGIDQEDNRGFHFACFHYMQMLESPSYKKIRMYKFRKAHPRGRVKK